MILSITLLLFWYSLFTYLLWRKGENNSMFLTRNELLIAFNIKVVASVVFILFFTYFYGNGVLSMDSGDYMFQSKLLFNVFKTSPLDYFKLLTGIGETDDLIFKYLKDAKHWKMQINSIFNDAKNVIRFNSLIYFFTNGFAYTHALIFSFVSFIGILKLAEAFSQFTVVKLKYIFLVMILFPSLLFWSSGILKEPFLIFGLGYFVYSIFINSKIKKRLIYFLIGFFILLTFKLYVLIGMLLAMIFYFILKKLQNVRPVYIFSLFIIGLITGLFIFRSATNKLVSKISERQIDFDNVGRGGLYCYDSINFYRIDHKDSVFYSIKSNKIAHFDSIVTVDKQLNGEVDKRGDNMKRYKPGVVRAGTYLMYDNRVASNSYSPIDKIDYSFENFLKFIPKSMVLAAIRPFPHEPGGALKYLAFFEVVILASWFIYVFFHRRKLSRRELYVCWSLFVFALLLLVVIGVTISITGALVRYRIPVYIAFIIISFILYSPSKVKIK